MVKYTDKEIIDGCLLKKPLYQEYLYNKYSEKMINICKKYCPDEDVAEDIIIESFVKVFEKLHTYNYAGSFEGWIKRIVYTTAMNELRSSSKRINDIDIDNSYHQIEYDAPTALDIMAEKDILRLIERLPSGYKNVFKLYVLDQYKHNEIAKEFNFSINTSKSQLVKARHWLQKRLVNYDINYGKL